MTTVELGNKLSGTMGERFESRDARHSTTTQLIWALLFGNVVVILAVSAFPFGPEGLGDQQTFIMSVGVMSFLTSGLLFLASAVRRRGSFWWMLALLLNLLQMSRLIIGVVAIGGWNKPAEMTALLWSFLVVPLLGVLSAVGLVMTMREIRKLRRRRLSHAA